MAENIQETRPPEPPPKPTEVPKPTEQSNRSEAKDHSQPQESRHSAQQDARNAARSEHAKASGMTAGDRNAAAPVPQQGAVDQIGPQQQADDQQLVAEEQARPRAETSDELTPGGDAPNSQQTGDNPSGSSRNGYTGPERWQHETQRLDPADDLRDQPQTTPEDNTATDKSTEIAARLNGLRDQGHGPQRHHDPTDEQLAARMGEPILDPRTGEPLLKDNGHVRAQNQIDPMTGTAVDGVHGGVHRCGDYATRIDSPDDYVAADRFMRQQIGDTGPAVARRPISGSRLERA